MKALLRWIAVLPSAILASLLVYAIEIWSGMLFGVTREDRFLGLLLDFIAHGLMGVVFVGAGNAMAPKKSLVLVITLAALFILFMGVSMFSTIVAREWRLSIISLGGVLGALAATQHLMEEYKAKRELSRSSPR